MLNNPPLNAPIFDAQFIKSQMWILWLSNLKSLNATVGIAVASGATITPSGDIFHVTGTSAINTINLPYSGFKGSITIIPDGIFTTGTSGNIALASTSVVGKTLIMTWDGSKWFPSY